MWYWGGEDLLNGRLKPLWLPLPWLFFYIFVDFIGVKSWYLWYIHWAVCSSVDIGLVFICCANINAFVSSFNQMYVVRKLFWTGCWSRVVNRDTFLWWSFWFWHITLTPIATQWEIMSFQFYASCLYMPPLWQVLGVFNSPFPVFLYKSIVGNKSNQELLWRYQLSSFCFLSYFPSQFIFIVKVQFTLNKLRHISIFMSI